jgi:hypothetical protein
MGWFWLIILIGYLAEATEAQNALITSLNWQLEVDSSTKVGGKTSGEFSG